LTQPLSEHLDEVRRAVAGSRRILLLLDFDGTLAPIVERPELAKLPEETRSLLFALNAEPRVSVAIVSGRSLADLRQHVGLETIYAGNHGLEIEGRGLRFQSPDISSARPVLAKFASELGGRLTAIHGAFIENKGPILSIHYRATEDAQIPLVLNAVESVYVRYTDVLELHHGKKVLEIGPRVRWNKGEAALWILKQLGQDGVLAVCAGDDRTDEDIFVALPDSISIKVGEGATAARYRVLGPVEMHGVLQTIYAAVRDANTSSLGIPRS
jgi:trehalose 6-phosphate phosphatase